MFKTAKRLIDKGYDVTYTTNAKGKVTKVPQLYVCPNCVIAAAKHTDSIKLQRRAAKNVVVGTCGDLKVALCSKCNWNKSNDPEATAAKKAGTTKALTPAEKRKITIAKKKKAATFLVVEEPTLF